VVLLQLCACIHAIDDVRNNGNYGRLNVEQIKCGCLLHDGMGRRHQEMGGAASYSRSIAASCMQLKRKKN